MGKAIINLDRWGIYNHGNFFCAFGIADKHPKLGKNVIISHTSEILKVEEVEDAYKFETHNSIYVCKLGNITSEIPYNMPKTKRKSKIALLYNKYYRYMMYRASKLSEEPISKYGIRLSNDEKQEFERILELSALCDKERKEKIKLHEDMLLKEASKYDNCIYIDLSSISRGSTAAFNINGKTGILNPVQHIGTFTDTVLYGNYLDKSEYIDFRYYVRTLGMETYCWTENIEKVIIHNSKEHEIRFNRNTCIAPNETVIILRESVYNKDADKRSISDDNIGLDSIFK